MDYYNEYVYRMHKHGNDTSPVVLMQMGDFYETYDQSAGRCQAVLGLKMNEQVKPDKTKHFITGFPKWKLEDYLQKLVGETGCRVVVLDKDMNETVFTKDSDGKIVFKSNNNNSNNSKTTTTMATTKFAAMRVINVYWFNTEREALVKLVLVRSNLKLDTGKVTHEWAEADGDPEKIVLMTDYDPEHPEQLPKFYPTPEAFEKGETYEASTLYWMRNEEDICSELLKKHNCRRCMVDEKGTFVWAFIKGQAVKWYFRKHIDVVTLHYKSNCLAYATADDAEVPENYYDAEDVYKYNDWVEVKDDGERVTHEGIYKRLMLEQDQVALADKLQAVLNECKEAGMKVYYNLCDYSLNAVNVRHIERVEYDPGYDEETEAAYHFEDDRAGRVFSGVYDLNTEDSDVKFVVKKG